MVGLQPPEAAVDMVLDGLPGPRLRACKVAAFGRQGVFSAAMRDRAADQLLAVVIPGRGVKEVEAAVQSGVQQRAHLPLAAEWQLADLEKSETKPAHP